MQRGEMHRPEVDPLDPVDRDGRQDLVGCRGLRAGPDGREEPDRPIGQAADRVGQDGRRAVVEELHVVDRDEDGPARLGELAQQPRDRDRQGPLVRRRGRRRLAQERDLEGVALRTGQAGERSVIDHAQQVDQAAERHPALGLRRSRRQHEPIAGAGLLGGGPPDRRLADPRLAREGQGGQAGPGPLQERLDRAELRHPPDDLVRHAEQRTPAAGSGPRRRDPSSNSGGSGDPASGRRVGAGRLGRGRSGRRVAGARARAASPSGASASISAVIGDRRRAGGRRGSPGRGPRPASRSTRQLRRLLDALGDGLEVERLAEPQDREDDRRLGRPVVEARDERAVDLQLVDREAAEVVQRRVAGPEVVDREPDAEALQVDERSRSRPRRPASGRSR